MNEGQEHVQALRLPSARAFVQTVEQELRAGRFVWVLAPSVDLVSTLNAALTERFWYDAVGQVSLGAIDAVHPWRGIAEALLSREVVATINGPDALAAAENLPEVIFLEQFETLSLADRGRWVESIGRWAVAPRRRLGHGGLCVTTTGAAVEGLKLVPNDVRVTTRLWAGIPSAQEVGALTRAFHGAVDARGRWREVLLPSLCGNDVRLVTHLWDAICGSQAQVAACLADYAARNGWERGDAESVISRWQPAAFRPGTQPVLSESDRALWRRGWLSYTPEYGYEVHSAIVALLEDDEELRHRLWRAQLTLVLPLADGIRVAVCAGLQHNHGQAWRRLANAEAGAGHMELGLLLHILRTTPRFSWEREQWHDAVNWAHLVRNSIAHYVPVPYSDYARLLQHYTKVQSLRAFSQIQ